MLAVRREAPFRLTARVAEAVASQGGKIKLPLAVERAWPVTKGPVTITAPDLPTGSFVAFPALTAADGKDEVEAVLSVAQEAPPGLYAIAFRPSWGASRWATRMGIPGQSARSSSRRRP